MDTTELLTTLHDGLFDWLMHGLGGFIGWQIVTYTLVTTHITIAAVTIFLHRSQAHRSVELRPVASHFFRCWLWLTTGIVTREWVAVHRKHHAACETHEDPHSPQTRGISVVLLRGTCRTVAIACARILSRACKPPQRAALAAPGRASYSDRPAAAGVKRDSTKPGT
ncbi:fatty acid desaturase [Acerihabitans sp. TG2]|uniref:fatty acid desaturase n=1 Tax=Acerihabitans sp. TG2 TaxID=3096008 RepID=UPI002B234981|nr:fatty acid desaturase [Acerihabitans sp. TG2]MEA9389051.1 fatty acid desaturase [Acerihabitans sp. TG2]